jgi:predicted dehydrogenase
MTFRWGIFGTGQISAKFVAGLVSAQDAKAVMVASRSEQRAREFADALNIPTAIGGYDATAALEGVDAVYIATPPAHHADHAVRCLQAGVPVLIEKPFAANTTDAKRIADAARASGTFCMEGMWTRFMPAAQQLKALVDSGALGEIRQVSGSFGFSNAVDPANGSFDPARGGGALAHLGVYPISLGQWLFGTPVTMAAVGRRGSTSVDEDVSLSLRYASGVIGSFHTSLRSNSANDFRVDGTHGAASFRGPLFRPYGLWHARFQPRARAETASLGRKALLREHGLAQKLAQIAGAFGPRRGGSLNLVGGNGYHYEADEVARCIAQGLTESPVMPLNDSMAIADSLDQIRRMIDDTPRA